MTEIVSILASAFGTELAKKIARELDRGESLGSLTLDKFVAKAKRRKIEMLLAVEKGKKLLEYIDA